jgi:hypothetical protein
LQLTIGATIVPIVPKCVGGVEGREFVVSRLHHPPPGGHCRLHALQSLKEKIKGNSTCKNLPHNQLKSGSCLSSSIDSKVFDLLVTRQSYILGLKEQINGMQKDLIQKEGEQRCVRLTMDIKLAMHTKARIEVDNVKVELKEAENDLSSSISMGGDHL